LALTDAFVLPGLIALSGLAISCAVAATVRNKLRIKMNRT
jgi:hypothetical protein